MSSSDSEILTPDSIKDEANNVIENLLPEISKERYLNTYNDFMKWRAEKNIKSFSESVFLTYFNGLSSKLQSSTLWSRYSMLKSTLSVKNNVNLKNFHNLTSFLKRQSQGFKSRKSKVFTSQEVDMFLNDAPDEIYLAVKGNGGIALIDPSQLLRPEPTFNDKPINAFRDYTVDDSDPIKERVRRTYYDMHTNVTVELVKQKRDKWLKFNTCKMTIKDALIKLNELVDESDPDTDLPNIVHAFQTAERIREDHPDEDWFHLTGLLHDLGKIMAFYDEPQWCVVGDTFVVGCKWADSIVYGPESFKDNPDTYNPKYNTKYGMYKPNCGLDNLLISWSHDEYMYQFLKHNKSAIPEKGLYMIRYHSLYPWHAGGDYRHLTNERDEKILKWVLEFNKYDLYTKSTTVPDIEALWPYYEKLIEKYIPGICEF